MVRRRVTFLALRSYIYFFLFPKLKTTLKGRRFQAIEEIQENATRELPATTESTFQETFQQWKKGSERCNASRGDCCEGGQCLKCCKMSNEAFIAKVRSFYEHAMCVCVCV